MGDRWAETARRRAGRAGRVAPRIVAAVLLAACLGGAAVVGAAGSRSGGHGESATVARPQIERLITGQRLQEAVRLLQSAHKAAQAAQRADDAARAAIRLAQVRMTLSHYELAVVVLHEQLQWQAQATARQPAQGAAASAPAQPATEVSRALLAMFYAQALAQYAQMYSFQVSQREPAAPPPPEAPFVSTLRSWTREQLFAAAQEAMATAWERRGALGQEPATALPEYREPGTLPREAQPTLRDLLTYQYVELLASRRLWPAEPPAAAGLAVGAPEAASLLGRDRLLDARLHPLTKLAAVLLDLASWHQAAGRSTAALAAHLERLSRLHQALADADGRARLRAELSELIAATAEGPAQASAQATLAELLQREYEGRPDPSGQLALAYATAAQGARRSPESPGGRRCRAIAQSLAAPEFALSGQTVDATGRPALRVEHRNLPALHLRAYPYDPVARLLSGLDELAPSGRELEALLRSGQRAITWTAVLPATPELQRRVTLLTPPLAAPGAYVVIASPRADFALTKNHLEAVHLQLSDVILWATAEPQGLHVTAVSGLTGEPLAEVELALYKLGPASPEAPLLRAAEPGQLAAGRRRPPSLLHSTRTGSDGGAELPRPDAEAVLVGRRGAQVALLERVPQLEADEPEVRPGAIIYTDRGVYGPRQKVLWKIAAYRSARGAEAAPAAQALGSTLAPPAPDRDAPVVVGLMDASAQQVARLTVRTNQFGTAAGEFILPAEARPGRWRLVTWHGGTPGGESSFLVQGPPLPRLVDESAAPRDESRFLVQGSPLAPPATGNAALASPLHAELQLERELSRSGEPMGLRVFRHDLWGHPRPGPASWRLVRLAPAPAGSVSLRALADGPEQSSGTLRHGPDGVAVLQLPGLPAGGYRLHYESRDELGQSCRAAQELVVLPAAGTSEAALGLPTLLLREQPQVRVGETARFAVLASSGEPALFVELHRPGGPVERRLLRPGPAPLLLELPVRPADRGQLVATLTWVRGHEFFGQEQSVRVVDDDGALRLELSAFSDLLRPGARASFKVQVRTATGAIPTPGTTELLAYMYDRSLDLLAPQQPPALPRREAGEPDPLAPPIAHSLSGGARAWLFTDALAEPPGRAAPRPDRLRLRLNFSLLRTGTGRPATPPERWRGAAQQGSLSSAPGTTAANSATVANSANSATAAAQVAIAVPAARELAVTALAQPGSPARSVGGPAATAFFLPQLPVQADGSAAIEFTVPDVVAKWTLRVVALTTDLRSAVLTRPTQTVRMQAPPQAAAGAAAPARSSGP